MFGKPVAQYLAFQKVVLAILAVVGLARLGLSLAGLPNAVVLWFSMNVVAWAGTVYYGVAVHTKGFGRYREILPLVFVQWLLFQMVAVLGILLAIAGRPNIFAAPEYSFAGQSQWVHLLAHLTIGLLVPTLLTWGVACLVMLITKKVTGRPVVV
jgi:hypothetical protein